MKRRVKEIQKQSKAKWLNDEGKKGARQTRVYAGSENNQTVRIKIP